MAVIPLAIWRRLRGGLALILLGLFLCGSLAADDLSLPHGLETHADGRQAIEKLYASYASLQEQGWTLEIVTQSQPQGREYALPIIALRSPKPGPAVWILAGIHGEEPAGPNAIAAAIDDIARLGRQRPVVLLPLLNPHGYANNWRYLNTPVYSDEIDGHSVGDSSHLLIDPAQPTEARAPAASSPEAAAITDFILRLSPRYPPEYSIDLHEDNLIDAGYVYSQGKLGAADPLATLAVRTLVQAGIAIQQRGQTRFGEPIDGGIIGPVIDSSIDELMSADRVMRDGVQAPGPQASTVLVFETPAGALPIEQRIEAHYALLQGLATNLAHPTAVLRRGYLDGPYGQIHYYEARPLNAAGAPTLILAHQSPVSARAFERALPLLAAANIRAIAVDTPGYGNSDAPPAPPAIPDYARAFEAVLDGLELERAHFLGHHTGASILANFAARYPQRVQSLILNGPPLLTAEELAQARKNVAPGPHPILPDGSHLQQRWDRRVRFSPGWTDEIAMHRRLVDQLWAGETAWYGHNAALSYEMMDDFMALSGNVLILTNTGDDIYDLAQRAHELRPEFSYRELQGGTHDIVDEQPMAWARTVAEFVLGIGSAD